MKKHLVLLVALATFLPLSSFAADAEGLYVGGNLGMAIPSDADVTESEPGTSAETYNLESDLGLALGAAVGYAFENIRVEGELAWQKNDFDKINMWGRDLELEGDISSLAFLLNGYYDFKNSSAFTPFVTAGIGMARIDIDDMALSGWGGPAQSTHDTVFAFQLGFGVSYAVSDRISLDVKYRYFRTQDPEFEGDASDPGTSEAEYSSHNIYVGIRIFF